MNNWIANMEERFASRRAAAPAAPPAVSDFSWRSLPNEDVFLYVKPFDNSHIVREADPREGRLCWKAFGGTVAGAAVLIGLLLPTASRWITGHQLEELQRERAGLDKRRGELRLELSQLTSMPRLMELARQKQMVEPSRRDVNFLQPPPQGALAMNMQSLKNPAQ